MATAELPLRPSKLSDKTDKNMPPALLEQYRKIQALLNKTTTLDAARRYQMAVLIRQVRDGEGRRYGQQAMKKIAKCMRYSEESLRLYAKVVDAWKESDFRSLMTRKTVRGRAISWTHVVNIAIIISPQKRTELLERVIAEDLSVAALKRVIDGRDGVSVTPSTAIPSTLRSGVMRMTAWAKTNVSSTELWKKTVLGRLRETDLDKIDQKLKDDLLQSYEAQVQAEKACRETRLELADVINLVTGKKMTVPKESPVGAAKNGTRSKAT